MLSVTRCERESMVLGKICSPHVIMLSSLSAHFLTSNLHFCVSRVFSVSEVQRQIDLLWETFYHQRCVLSVAVCSLQDGKGNR